jgi:Zn-dependent peptidase ImmA (M78 family)/transcriptional regulator with XRE-family HTH domain
LVVLAEFTFQGMLGHDQLMTLTAHRFVSAKTLRWAREQVKLDLGEASVRLRLPRRRLENWEDGRGSPGITALRKLASLYKRPLAFFFLTEPPEGVDLPDDFRTRTIAGRAPELSRDLIVAIREVKAWQRTLSALIQENPDLGPAVEVPSLSTSMEPEYAGSILRSSTGLTDQQQISFGNSNRAFQTWRERVEALGTMVCVIDVKRDSCRGFSLWGDQAMPAIAISSEEKSSQARLFTIAHELAHLSIRKEGICILDHDSSVERFCNRSAAAMLMPVSLLERFLPRSLNRVEWTNETLSDIAHRIFVSVPALALRLEELGFAPQGLYISLWEREPSQLAATPSQGGGGSWPGVRISERGSSYSRVVFEAWRRNRISLADAARSMNMPPRYVRAMDSSLARRRA